VRWTAFRQSADPSRRSSFQVGQRSGSFQLARSVAKAMKVLTVCCGSATDPAGHEHTKGDHAHADSLRLAHTGCGAAAGERYGAVTIRISRTRPLMRRCALFCG
jgi:hypothetical protein